MVPHSCAGWGSWENMGISSSDDDKREPLGPRITGQYFPTFLTTEPCFQTKPYGEPQYVKQEQGSYLADDPGAQREGSTYQGWPVPWRPCHLPTPGARHLQLWEGYSSRRNAKPATVWGARALNAEARTLAVCSTGADCIGGL